MKRQYGNEFKKPAKVQSNENVDMTDNLKDYPLAISEACEISDELW